MEQHNLQPLEQDDIFPYDPEFKRVVVRIYIGRQWFAGKLSSLSMKDNFTLRVQPMARLHPHMGAEDTVTDWPHVIRDQDQPIALSYNDKWPPFTLLSPQKIVSDTLHLDTLIIVFKGGVAILSKQDTDIAETEKFLELAKQM